MTTCNAVHSPQRPAFTLWLAAGAAAVAAVSLTASPAIAQPEKADFGTAEALFQEARRLVKAGNYAEGCPKFDAAFALYSSPSTMLNIADCREREGKLASAWEAFHRAIVLNRETEGTQRRQSIEEAAKQGIRSLEPRLPKIVLRISSPPPGMKVLRDGKELPAAALSQPLPADPGANVVSVSAPGYRSETRSLTVREGETAELEIELARTSDAGAAGGAGAGVPMWVWPTGGAGIALIAGGTFFLIDHRSAVGALREGCPTNETGTRCAPGYDYQSDNARKNRGLAFSLGLGGAGVLALGAATTGLVLSSASRAPSEKALSARAAAWVMPGSAGAIVTGRF